MQLITDNSKENWNSNNKDNTHTSINSNLKKLIQLDNYNDLLLFISNEKIKTNKNFVKNYLQLNKNFHQKILNLDSNTKKHYLIDIYNFLFDFIIRINLKKFYNLNPDNYNKIIVENLIFNKNCHMVAVFKDHMVFDYVDEFLKRYYFIEESEERIPKISNYYKNYLKFFCNPVFRDFKANNIIQGYGDYKAEMYYNRNYGSKGISSGNENDYKPNIKKYNPEESKLKKIFDTNAKINIEKDSIIISNNLSTKNNVFNESNFKYYIDKKQINKIKYGKFYEDLEIFKNKEKNLKSFYNNFSNINNSKFTNTLVEFSQFYLNNNDIKEYNNDISNILGNVNDISNIIQCKDSQSLIKEHGKIYEKQNKNLINKKLKIVLNKSNSCKEINEEIKNHLNNNIIEKHSEKINKNKSKEKIKFDSEFNENENISKPIKILKKNNQNGENLFTNRSYEESIINIINIMDMDKENDKLKAKLKNWQKHLADKENSVENKIMRKEQQKTYINESKKIIEVPKLQNKSIKLNDRDNKDIINKIYKSSNSSVDYNVIQANRLNNDNPYIIKKSDYKDKKLLSNINSNLNKMNVKKIESNSNSKSKSDSKTFTELNNNLNNLYLGTNGKQNSINNTNHSRINLNSYNSNEINNNIKSESQVKVIFKPKINTVEIIKNNLCKENWSNLYKNNKFKSNKIDNNIDYQKFLKIIKTSSKKNFEKSNEDKDKDLTIYISNKNYNEINDSILIINNKIEDFEYNQKDLKYIHS